MVAGRRYLGEFEQLVLLAVLHLGGEGYGRRLGAEIERRTGRRPSLGSLYSTLERLSGKGLVRSRTGQPTPRRGGRPKRFYEITALGRESLLDSRRMLDAMWKDATATGGGDS